MINVIRSCALAVVFVAGAAGAASYPKEGRFDYIACSTSTFKEVVFSKTQSARSFEQIGTIMSNPPGEIFDNSSFRCEGMSTLLDGKAGGMVVCESIDADGDKRLSRFSIASDGARTRELLAGTGKYEGMTTTSDYKLLGPFPEVKPGVSQSCNHQTGTYKLK